MSALTLSRTIFLTLSLCIATLSFPSVLLAETTTGPLISPANTDQVLSILKDPEKRDALISTLQSIQQVESKTPVNQSLLEMASSDLKSFEHNVLLESTNIIHTIANFRAFLPWVNKVWHTPVLQTEILEICIRVAVVAFGGLILSKIVRYLLSTPRRKLEESGEKVARATGELLKANTQNIDAAQEALAASLAKEQKIKDAINAPVPPIKPAAAPAATSKVAAGTTATTDPDTSTPSAAAVQAAEAAHEASIATAPDEGTDPETIIAESEVDTQNPIPAPSTSATSDSKKPRASKSDKPKAMAMDSSSSISEPAPASVNKDLPEQLAAAQDNTAKIRAEIADLQRHARQIRSRNHWRKIPYALTHFILDLFGIAMFPLVAFLVQNFGGANLDARSLAAIWSVTLFANVGQSAWVALLFILFARNPHWIRLAPVSDTASVFLFKWLRRIGFCIAWGVAGIIIFRSCTLPDSVTLALGKLLGLVVHLMLAVMIINARPAIFKASEDLQANNQHLATFCKWGAQLWWMVALFFDFALWFVWAADINEGYQIVLEVFIRTCIALFVSRGIYLVVHNTLARLFGAISKDNTSRVSHYYPALQRGATVMVAIISAMLVAVAWGIPVERIFTQNTLGKQLASSTATILFALIMGIVVWETTNIFINRQIQKIDFGDQATVAQKAKVARIKTLQPLFKIILLIVLVATIGMTTLSEIGLNIAPLLASASIFGVALGFGSQKLVHDFISGVFLLLENALAVGDTVTLNGTYGVVEKMSLRTVHVRASDGSLNIFPFSSLDKIINFNRGFSRVIVEAGVSYNTDVTTVIEILSELVTELRQDPNFGPYIIDDFKVWGLSEFGDSAITIKGTIAVIPSGRSPVKWEFNRRMYNAFNERGIDMPYPTRTLDIPGLDKLIQSQSTPPVAK